MRTLDDNGMEQLIKRLQEILTNKDDALNRQEVDREVSAFISVYKYGNASYKVHAKKWLCSFCANAGLIKNSYTLGWNNEVENGDLEQLKLF